MIPSNVKNENIKVRCFRIPAILIIQDVKLEEIAAGQDTISLDYRNS
jgi:hypothetical protein